MAKRKTYSNCALLLERSSRLPANGRLSISTLRYEARNLYSHDTHDWSLENRIRSRFGAQIPLASPDKAWRPKSFYTLVDVEPFWTAGKGLNMVRFRTGVGYIPSDRLRVEFLYHIQWGQATGSDELVYNQNIFRLNVMIGLKRSILSRVWNP